MAGTRTLSIVLAVAGSVLAAAQRREFPKRSARKETPMTPERLERLRRRLEESKSQLRRIEESAQLEAFLEEAGQKGAPFAALSGDETVFTLAEGLILETGVLILSNRFGDARRSVLLSDRHYALVDEEKVFETLGDYLRRKDLSRRESGLTTLTLICGPSRTADIEKILILGVHGPKRLVVLVVG